MDYRQFVCDCCENTKGWFNEPCIYCVNNPKTKKELSHKILTGRELKNDNYYVTLNDVDSNKYAHNY